MRRHKSEKNIYQGSQHSKANIDHRSLHDSRHIYQQIQQKELYREQLILVFEMSKEQRSIFLATFTYLISFGWLILPIEMLAHHDLFDYRIFFL